MAPKPNIYKSKAHSGPYFDLHWPPLPIRSTFFLQYFKQQCWAPKRYIQKWNCYLIRPCIIRHGNSIMFPAQLIQTARAINYIKTFLARVSYQSWRRIEGSDFTRMLMTRGRSSTLVTHLLMCNKLYNLIFLGDKRMICNRISALMSTHIY